MTGTDLIAALDIPEAARVDRRVPKTLLLEHGASSASDRRQIKDGIERIQWVAALKPGTIGVAAYRDEVREYVEIAILHVTLRVGAREQRIVELLHRAVPYPVVAVAESDASVSVSLVHKRWSQGEADKTVLEGDPVYACLTNDAGSWEDEFIAALELGRQPRASLHALYQGWLDTLLALEAARRTGEFVILVAPEARAARREALQECTRLEADASRLRAAASREKQMSKQVELNLELKRVEAAQAVAFTRL